MLFSRMQKERAIAGSIFVLDDLDSHFLKHALKFGIATNRILLNSAILAPVFWSWIIKPICKYFKIDYKDINILD